MAVVAELFLRERSVLCVDGPLRVPLNGDLDWRVEALLDRGERYLVLDLTGVPAIDAGGVGALIRLYNRFAAVDGTVRILHPTARVREILQCVGVFDLLTGASDLRAAG